jgi:YidC/Oxa1 family membrane protein insertase
LPEIKNPNQQGGGGDNRSLLLTMVVMFAVFFWLRFYTSRHNPQTAPPGTPAVTQKVAPAKQNGTAAGQVPVASQSAPKGSPAAANQVVAAAEQTTTIENELYRIEFTNRGGQVEHWFLKRYKDSTGAPLDLVHQQAAEAFGRPLSLYTYDAGLTAQLAQALYVPSQTGTVAAPTSLSFHYAADGLDVTKTFRFDETYVLHADVAVTKNGAPVRALLAWPGGFGDQESLIAYAQTQLDTSTNDKAEHIAFKKVTGGGTLNGPFDWAGTSDNYFAAVFLPDHPATATVATFSNQLTVSKDARHNGIGQGVPAKSGGTQQVPVVGAAIGDVSGHTETRIYAGPKLMNVLRSIHASGTGATLEPLINFGFWGPIGKYLFLALQFIHAHFASNWGWAIVLLTVILNILMLPFRMKTMKSGLQMQRIQPQMDAIKAKYKSLKVTDPKRNEMNAELMKVQKENGVNMFGGCIPTLMTIPLLWAFFGMLTAVVELRQAHWLWIPDLSVADPWHILPIIMIVSQFLMQFYTPSPGVDPQQQRMMAFMMPAISGYFTWNYAAGLGLYWAIGNLISIATQQVMNRTSVGKEMRELAAKRARRQGSGSKPAAKAGARTIQGRR